jgi:hypothetical protein
VKEESPALADGGYMPVLRDLAEADNADPDPVPDSDQLSIFLSIPEARSMGKR